MSAPEPAGATLEAALERLEEIAQQLEGSELELTDALALYEEGVRLLRRAEGVIGGAEQRIHALRSDGAGHRVEPLEGEE